MTEEATRFIETPQTRKQRIIQEMTAMNSQGMLAPWLQEVESACFNTHPEQTTALLFETTTVLWDMIENPTVYHPKDIGNTIDILATQLSTYLEQKRTYH